MKNIVLAIAIAVAIAGLAIAAGPITNPPVGPKPPTPPVVPPGPTAKVSLPTIGPQIYISYPTPGSIAQPFPTPVVLPPPPVQATPAPQPPPVAQATPAPAATPTPRVTTAAVEDPNASIALRDVAGAVDSMRTMCIEEGVRRTPQTLADAVKAMLTWQRNDLGRPAFGTVCVTAVDANAQRPAAAKDWPALPDASDIANYSVRMDANCGVFAVKAWLSKTAQAKFPKGVMVSIQGRVVDLSFSDQGAVTLELDHCQAVMPVADPNRP